MQLGGSSEGEAPGRAGRPLSTRPPYVPNPGQSRAESAPEVVQAQLGRDRPFLGPVAFREPACWGEEFSCLKSHLFPRRNWRRARSAGVGSPGKRAGGRLPSGRECPGDPKASTLEPRPLDPEKTNWLEVTATSQ